MANRHCNFVPGLKIDPISWKRAVYQPIYISNIACGYITAGVCCC